MSNHKGKHRSCEVDAISSKLKFVAKIQPGQKISVNTQSIQNNTYATSLIRYLQGESREKVYRFISDLVKDAFSVLDSYANSKDPFEIEDCKNMIIDLINLEPGLRNLRGTYKNDPRYVSDLETLIQNLETRTKKLCSERNLNYEELKTEAANRLLKEIGQHLSKSRDRAFPL